MKKKIVAILSVLLIGVLFVGNGLPGINESALAACNYQTSQTIIRSCPTLNIKSYTGTYLPIITITRQGNIWDIVYKNNNWYTVNSNKNAAQTDGEKTETKQETTTQPKTETKPETTTQPKQETPSQPVTQGLSTEQTRMLELINEERTKAGVKPLTWDIELANVANVKAKDMVDNNYFAHESPNYGSPFDMMKKFGIKYYAAGENIAGYNNVDKAHVGLMNSDGHRKNILNPNFTHVGIGVQKSSKYGYVFVQMFIGK
ncbi:MAG: CAP domain-containing protein [Xylanivirga thermophila]|jgi:uncharacterized YkwD family protein|uniref:CAP domain-containing protein n=1 Tax=Xylanivirga thermophila TaxID=2496273 RepID=UPI00101BDD1F|nr:CAP domain-containing protein [Xylanivirga thermophila]